MSTIDGETGQEREDRLLDEIRESLRDIVHDLASRSEVRSIKDFDKTLIENEFFDRVFWRDNCGLSRKKVRKRWRDHFRKTVFCNPGAWLLSESLDKTFLQDDDHNTELINTFIHSDKPTLEMEEIEVTFGIHGIALMFMLTTTDSTKRQLLLNFVR